MKREIKFRAWDGETLFIPKTLTDLLDEINLPSFWHGLTFMQYTGLKDKNGKEIYEDDILTESGGERWVISFKEYSWYIGQDTFEEAEHLQYCKIIGNIHENPELL